MTLAFIFDSIGVGEWFVLLAVVLVVVGPKRLPSTARKFGQYYSKFRRAAEGFKRQLLDMDTEINNAITEAENAAANEMKDVDEAIGTSEEPQFNPEEYGMPPDDYSYGSYDGQQSESGADGEQPTQDDPPSEVNAGA